MTRAVSMTASDKKWEEDSYARTLSEAESIKKDRKKMKMARTGAKRQAKEKQAEATAMKKIARAPKKSKPKARGGKK